MTTIKAPAIPPGFRSNVGKQFAQVSRAGAAWYNVGHANMIQSSNIAELFATALRDAMPKVAAARLAAPTLPGASSALTALALGRIHPQALVLVVAPGPTELEALHADLLAFAPVDRAPLFFPATEGEGESVDPELAGLRMSALRALTETTNTRPTRRSALQANRLVATSVHALQQPVPDPRAVENAAVHLRVGAEYAFDDVVARMVAGGYTRTAEVGAKGELAVRGGLLDVWPPTADMPLRAEFFDAALESLRAFDPATQCSVEKKNEAWIPPCQALEMPQVFLPDLLPEGAVIVWLDHDRLRDFADMRSQKSAAKHLDWDELTKRLAARHPRLELFCGDPPPAATPALPLEIAALPGLAEIVGDGRHPDVLAAARHRLLGDFTRRGASGENVVLCMDTAGACEQLHHELGADAPVQILHARLSGGFVLPAARLVVAAQPDLNAVRKQYGRRYLPTTATAGRGERVESLADLEIGHLVVHLDHGIGRYTGVTEIEMDGKRTEVITLEYAEGAKLHVPVSHAHLLSRYVGVAGQSAHLHRLGGKRWTREKTDAERAIRDLAGSLLETQARRQVRIGIAFQCDPAWMETFDAAFPYQETADQKTVIADVKADMQSKRPMDRLVCGDAGYGKTEIAMRAAFISVMNGRQVAVLVPTTVLAEQHYESFCERMAAYPIRIEVLSRFRTAVTRQRVLAALADGRVDIVIGTHALLQPGIAFKELGLLVIDEEQRFGVENKERLKQVRQIVDVLTLTATPIPRTLYLSMTGVRDMSLLQTPPQERLAVETRLARDNDSVIRNAILQELNREGQVFFLFNRVQTIELMRARLEKLVPEARIAVAHGQMSAGQLARIMRDFESGEYDVLLCTTIVESGLDIPRANTIIVHRADRFGIADLYQLRGRVGRSSHKAFAWLLLPEHGHVDEDARQRLAAIQKHSGLGAGFGLAMRDLEIRGAGNMLGAAQSGHIAAIGFGLYCQLLRRTVARLKGEKPPVLVDVDLQFDFIDFTPGTPDPETSVCLPYTYVEDEPQRLALHRRLAEAVEVAELKKLRAELTDRYGRPPPPVVRWLRLAELRIAAAQKGITRIETHDNKVWLFRNRSREPLMIDGRLPHFDASSSAEKKLTALFRLVEGVEKR